MSNTLKLILSIIHCEGIGSLGGIFTAVRNYTIIWKWNTYTLK